MECNISFLSIFSFFVLNSFTLVVFSVVISLKQAIVLIKWDMLWTFYENFIVKKNVLSSNMSSAI